MLTEAVLDTSVKLSPAPLAPLKSEEVIWSQTHGYISNPSNAGARKN